MGCVDTDVGREISIAATAFDGQAAPNSQLALDPDAADGSFFEPLEDFATGILDGCAYNQPIHKVGSSNVAVFLGVAHVVVLNGEYLWPQLRWAAVNATSKKIGELGFNNTFGEGSKFKDEGVS